MSDQTDALSPDRRQRSFEIDRVRCESWEAAAAAFHRKWFTCWTALLSDLKGGGGAPTAAAAGRLAAVGELLAVLENSSSPPKPTVPLPFGLPWPSVKTPLNNLSAIEADRYYASKSPRRAAGLLRLAGEGTSAADLSAELTGVAGEAGSAGWVGWLAYLRDRLVYLPEYVDLGPDDRPPWSGPDPAFRPDPDDAYRVNVVFLSWCNPFSRIAVFVKDPADPLYSLHPDPHAAAEGLRLFRETVGHLAEMLRANRASRIFNGSSMKAEYDKLLDNTRYLAERLNLADPPTPEVTSEVAVAGTATDLARWAAESLDGFHNRLRKADDREASHAPLWLGSPQPPAARAAAGLAKAEEITNSLKEFLTDEFARLAGIVAPPVGPPPSPARVRCDPVGHSVYLDETLIATNLTSVQFRFVSAVVQADPDPISFPRIMGRKTKGMNPTHIMNAINKLVRGSMPGRDLRFIVGRRGVGYCLNLPKKP